MIFIKNESSKKWRAYVAFTYKLYSNQALLSPNLISSSSLAIFVSLNLITLFFLFWSHKYHQFVAANTTIKAENTNNVTVAFVYLGGALSDPRSQVARIPPELVRMNPIAIAVALLV